MDPHELWLHCGYTVVLGIFFASKRKTSRSDNYCQRLLHKISYHVENKGFRCKRTRKIDYKAICGVQIRRDVGTADTKKSLPGRRQAAKRWVLVSVLDGGESGADSGRGFILGRVVIEFDGRLGPRVTQCLLNDVDGNATFAKIDGQ